MTRRWGLTAVLLVAMAVHASGCAMAMDRKSGEDQSRAGAKEVKLNKLHYDRLAAREGDHTDWKTFKVEGDARVTVDVWWDDPSVEARVQLKDQVGRVMARAEHELGSRKDSVGPVSLEAGQYYLQVRLTDGASVYTVDVHTESGAAPRRPQF